MTFAERAHTEPPPGGFMRSVMGYRAMDDMDEGIIMLSPPEKQSSSGPVHLPVVTILPNP